MKSFMVFIVALLLGGCVSATTSAKICADLNVVNKTVGAINANVGVALAEWTPKKCGSVGVNADAGKLTGGVNIGVSNE